MSRKPCLSLLACVLTILGLMPTFHQGAASPGSGLSLTATRGIVGSNVGIVVTGIPTGDRVDILWDGRSIVTVDIDQATGFGTASLKVPAAIKGNHTISGRRENEVFSSKPFEVVPRIKLIPGMVGWGDQVNVSLRGYAPWTIVRIRWLRGSAWVEVARVSTSKTGSANIFVTVPSWAPAGPNSVRGDAVTSDGGRAQTNAFRADRLISIADPVESPHPIEPTSKSASPTPTASVEPTSESIAPPTSTPTEEPTPSGTPVPQVSKREIAHFRIETNP